MSQTDHPILQHNRRRGKRVFLWLLGAFLLAQLSFGLTLDHAWPSVRFPEAALVWAALDSGPSPSIVWLGSSRSESAIRADVSNAVLWQKFGKEATIFNAAVPIGDGLAMEHVFDGICKRGYRPRVVVIEVAPELQARDSFWLRVHHQRQICWSEVPGLLPETVRSKNLSHFLSYRFLPIGVYRQEAWTQGMAHLRGEMDDHWKASPVWNWHVIQESGDSPPPVRLANEPRPASGVDFLTRWLRNYRTDGYSSAAVTRLLRRCQQENMTTVLVRSPIAQDTRAAYIPQVETPFAALIQGWRKEFGCAYHDLKESVPDGGFGDFHHLNADGANWYSRLAMERVVVPAWLARR